MNANKESKMQIALYDLAGRMIAEKKPVTLFTGENQVALNVSGIESGIYLMLIESEDSVVKLKLVVQR